MIESLERRCWLPIAICLLTTLLGYDARSVKAGEDGDAAKNHWAFRAVRRPELPVVKHDAWTQTPIDRFILAKLESAGLAPAPAADRRTLIRRATFDLIGLPPTQAEIDEFANDPASTRDAFAKVVDRLLASPRYGERWGRYWLDVARYADTKGYIFTEERRFPYSHTYRDWVIQALNDDLPYDQFLIQQLAADCLPLGENKRPLAALGFLTLGRRFLGNIHDIIDDRIDVVARGTMGLTVGCARCHDHKYDPIPTADYYSLYGIFASASEKQVAIATATPEFERELSEREGELNQFLNATLDDTRHKLRTRAGEYLLAAESIRDHPDIMDFMFVENPGDINRFVLGRWRKFLDRVSKPDHAVLGPWHAFAALPEPEFAAKAGDIARQVASQISNLKSEVSNLKSDDSKRFNPLVAAAFTGDPPQTLGDVGHRYNKLFADAEESWQKLLADAKTAGTALPTALADAAQEELRQLLYGDRTPTSITDKEADDCFEKPAADKLRQLRKKVQETRTSPNAPPNAMALVENDPPNNPYVFVRGNPGNHGPTVPRQLLTVLAGERREPFKNRSGRLELAQAIASKDNPLTARVLVNRVWLQHFGAGLVKTPSDFGVRSDPPSHPELLDWLASELVESGWSLKKLHRLIMKSSVYQQASEAVGSRQLAVGQKDASVALMPTAYALLPFFPRRRLDFEATRDSLLAVAGDLDVTVGGVSVDLAKQPYSRRRTVYGFIERQNLPGMLRTFDFASPDTHCPERHTTTVPQQALFLMNSPFVVEQAKRLAARPEVAATADPADRIRRLYSIVFDRAPSDDEIALGREFIEGTAADSTGGILIAWERYAHALLMSNEFVFVD